MLGIIFLNLTHLLHTIAWHVTHSNTHFPGSLVDSMSRSQRFQWNRWHHYKGEGCKLLWRGACILLLMRGVYIVMKERGVYCYEEEGCILFWRRGVYIKKRGVYHYEGEVCIIMSDWPWHQCCPLHCQFVQQFAELWIFPSPEKISLGYIGSLISTNRHNFQTNLCQTRRFGDLWSTSLVNCIVCHISAPTASFRTCKS